MKELVRRMIEEPLGVKLSAETIEQLTKRFDEMVEANKKLNEMDIWQEEPMVTFSREPQS